MTLRLDALSFGYLEGELVLADVDLQFESGELVCLIGPNGSGKSTLLRLCAGLLTPVAGSARWNGRELADTDPIERARNVAFLPQTTLEGASLRVIDIVRLGRHPHLVHVWSRMGEADQRAVDAALRRMELSTLVDRRMSELSGGERQRVLLAASLAQGGELLLLDEPTASLDLHHQVSGMELIRGLSREGRCVVCATHDLNLAATTADRLVLLQEGHVRASGTPGEVLTTDHLNSVFGEEVWVGPHPAGEGIAVLPRPGGRR